VFLDAYRDGGRGPLAVTVSAPDRAMAEAAVAALYYLARRRGVVEAALAVTLTDTGPAPMGIALRYTDFVAVPPACNPEVVLSRNPNGEVSPNLGCALEGSVTAMLAHPADYLSPAASTPGDGSRFGRIVDDYRQGKATQAEVNRNDDLKASTIAVNK
jgi:type IV pilus biogenesis protein CpaD/CtpE